MAIFRNCVHMAAIRRLNERLEGSQGPRGPTGGGEQMMFFPTGIQSSSISHELRFFANPPVPDRGSG